MINTKFEAYKIRRELKRSGKQFDIFRHEVNAFNERSGSPKYIRTIDGIYHEQNSNVQFTPDEGAVVRTKKIPMILALYDDCIDCIKVDDEIHYVSKKYRVVGINDVQSWNIVIDISLEAVDDGEAVV